MFRTAYLDANQADLTTQLQHAIRDRCTALIYGTTRCSTRLEAAILTTETTIGRPLRVTREHDRWVIHR